MGVSGSGKTTVGKALAEQLGFPFLDADDFHPQQNIAKMQAGKALNDTDRQPWLEQLNLELRKHKDTGVVLACSALKAAYRELLEKDIKIHWTHLQGDFELIQARMQLRSHFMPAALLQSQFDALEPLEQGLTLDIDSEIEFLVNMIRARYETKGPANWGIVGMGVMGQSLALNAIDSNIRTAVYNRIAPGEELVIAKMLNKYTNPKLYGYTDWKEFTDKLTLPRKILLMIPAGKAIDAVIEDLLPFLSPGDCIVDGGNSHFSDTENRIKKLQEQGIEYLGMGVSGGEEGARIGPAMMPGGSDVAYEALQPILEKIAAKDPEGKACVGYLGRGGCGHLVKTVHNGIEYAEMQLLAELYALIGLTDLPRAEFAALFEQWNSGQTASYLMSIMPAILDKKEGATYLVDLILDEAAHKGTGAWTAHTALDYGHDASIISTALNVRYHSTAQWFRELAKPLNRKASIVLNFKQLIDGYQAARILNHLQGLRLIKTVSEANDWQVDLAEVTRIWTNGCIIKSHLIEQLHLLLKEDPSQLETWCFSQYQQYIEALKVAVTTGISSDLALPVFSAALQFGLAINDPETTANIIQAQRDFFGAHTYKRKDKDREQNFHTDWTKP